MKILRSQNKIERISTILAAALILVCVSTGVFGLFVNTTHATASWYDNNWTYRTQITIDHTKVGNGTEDETDFPVEISLSGLSNINANGSDIRFTSSDGTTLLPREIESYSGGNLIAWVKVPTLSHTSDTVIYMYYGNSSATEPAANSTYGSQNVWDGNFKGVWHLADPTNPIDSTINANNGTNHGTTATTSEIGNGANFVAGSSQYITGTGGALQFEYTDSFSASCWVYANNLVNTDNYDCINNYDPSALGGWALSLFHNGSSNTVRAYFIPTSGWSSKGIGVNASTELGNQAWHLISFTYSGTGLASGVQIYVDGNPVTTTSFVNGGFSGATIKGGHPFLIGRTDEYYNGKFDEIEVSKTVRSAGWLKTDYNNQSSTSTFYSLSAPTVPDAPTSLNVTAGNTQASLSWSAPANNEGSLITDYVVDYKLSSGSVWSTFADGVSTVTSATITGLTNGASYDFRVSAVNGIGQGSPSGTFSATPATTPDAPTIGTATAGNAQATATFNSQSTSWYNDSWGYRTKITIDHTKVPNTDQSYFPVLISRTDSNWKSTGSGGHVGQTDGGDFLFTSSNGVTKLNHEVETYVPSTGQLIAWVQIPTLSHTSDTVIYVYYGNASVADQWNVNATWNDGGTSHYTGVWHEKEGSGTSVSESSGSGNTGTLSGTLPTWIAGEIGNALDFHAGYINTGSPFYLSNSTPLTISWWEKVDDTSFVYNDRFNLKINGATREFLAFRTDNSAYGSFGWIGWGSGEYLRASGVPSVASSVGTWHHWALVSTTNPTSNTAANWTVYVDGIPYAASIGSDSGFSGNTHNQIGASAFAGEPPEANMDDIQISNIARSADWIATEYHNQNSPSTFYSAASEEALANLINNGGSAITSFIITSSPGNISTTTSSTATSGVVTGLTNGTSYSFTVAAVNAFGTGPSSSSSNSVIPATVPNAPTALSATAGNTQVSLSWSAPAYDGGSSITDYVIEYKLDSDSSWSVFSDGVSTATTTIITGLTNGSLYDFRVSAVNSAGQGSASSQVTSTPYTNPSAPLNVVATRGNTSASIAFDPPALNGGSVITNYTVTSNPENKTGTGTSSPITVSNLTNGTAYTFTVTATNAAGTGPASSPSNQVTPATIPDAPTGLIATPGQGQVDLSWTAPTNNGGAAVTDYVVEYKLSSDISWSTFADGVSAATTATVTGLTNASAYDFRVSAVNDVGQGSPSAQTSATPVTVPDAPTIGAATPGNSQATVTFTPPAFDGGSAINNYTVTSNPGSFIGVGNASPITVTGLTNGTSYTFTVTATNSIGTGASSSPSNAVVPVTVPNAPTSVVATPGNRQASVAFNTPTSDGGSPITSYTVTSDPDGVTASGSSSPIVVSGLTKGATYQFTVTAANAVGTSSPSSPSNSVTLFTEPGTPTNLAATVQGSSVALTWSAPASDGGSAITDYIVEYQLSASGTWAVFADGMNTNTSATVTGLSDGTSYDFRVSAVNVIGESTSSNPVTATPGEPAQVIIQSFPDLTSTEISTAVRITNEGSSSYEYQYTWCVTDSQSNLCGGGDDVFDSSAAKLIQTGQNFDTTLVSSVPIPGNYWFHISVAYGSQSSSAYQSFTAVATYPDPPTSVTASPDNVLATISFTAPASNGGSAITGYTVTSSPGGLSGVGSTSPIIVTGLTNGIAYTFTVTATNAVGTSVASSPSNSVTPATVPDPPASLSATAGDSQVTLNWSAPLSDGGSVITDYVIEYKLSSDSTWIVFADGVSTATTVTVTGLTNNVSYDFRVSAVNSVGQSAENVTSASAQGSSGGGGSNNGVAPNVGGGGYVNPPSQSTTTGQTNVTQAQSPPENQTTPVSTSPNNTIGVVSVTPSEHPSKTVVTAPTQINQTANSQINSNKSGEFPWTIIILIADLVLTLFLLLLLFWRRLRIR